jgi:hypothetical protein
VKPGEQWQVPFCRVSNIGQDWVDGAALGCWVCSLDGDWLGADSLEADGASVGVDAASLGGISETGASLEGDISLGDDSLTGEPANGTSLENDSLDIS